MYLYKLDMREAASRGALMVLRHPASGEELTTDDGGQIYIELLGMDSPEYRQLIRAAATRNVSRGRKRPSPELLEQEGITLLAGVTKGWGGVVVGGEVIAFSPEAAKRLYTDYAWIREQVDEFVGERGNFLLIA